MKNFKIILALLLGLAPINFKANAAAKLNAEDTAIVASVSTVIGLGTLAILGIMIDNRYQVAKAAKGGTPVKPKYNLDFDEEISRISSRITGVEANINTARDYTVNVLGDQQSAKGVLNISEQFLDELNDDLTKLRSDAGKQGTLGTEELDKIGEARGKIRSVQKGIGELRDQIDPLPETMSMEDFTGMKDLNSALNQLESGSESDLLTLKEFLDGELPEKLEKARAELKENTKSVNDTELANTLSDLDDSASTLSSEYENLNLDEIDLEDFFNTAREISSDLKEIKTPDFGTVHEQLKTFLDKAADFTLTEKLDFLDKLGLDADQINKFNDGKLSIEIKDTGMRLFSGDETGGIDSTGASAPADVETLEFPKAEIVDAFIK